MKGYLGYTDEVLVSTDFETFPISSNALRPYVFTLRTGMTMDGGVFVRVVDLIKHMAHANAKA